MASVLSEADLEAFVDAGYVRVRHAVPRDIAAGIRAAAAELVADPRGVPWCIEQRSVYDMPILVEAVTDRVRGAFDQLAGPGKWHIAANWGFPTRFPGDMQPLWHIDGDWFTHHVDSGEQILTPIFLWSDVDDDDGPTLLCPGSHRPTARLLADHEPEGIAGDRVLAVVHENAQIDEVVPTTGEAGDLIVCHPFLVHSVNPAGPRVARRISNVAIHGYGPLDVGTASQSTSPVERAIASALVAARRPTPLSSPGVRSKEHSWMPRLE